jgi:hypothetical protein
LTGISWRPQWLAAGVLGCGAILACGVPAGSTGRLLPVAVAPGIAAFTAVATLAGESWRWSGATPRLVWLTRGAVGLCAATLGQTLAAGLLAAAAGSLGLTAPALAGYAVYLAAFLALVVGAALLPADADAGVSAAVLLVVMVYASPLFILAVAELFPSPAAIAAAFAVWPPAVAAGVAGVDLVRLPFCYTNLPVAYYPYVYPSPWLAAGLLAAPALLLHARLWLRRIPPTGWPQSFWSTP